MMIKTSGDLRSFLGEVLVGIRNGTIDVAEANAISKVSAQITNSLALEVRSAIQMKTAGVTAKVEDMSLTTGEPIGMKHLPVEQGGGIWCDQCEARVSVEDVASCKSKFCKAKEVA